MPVTTPARYRLGSATRTSSTRFAIPSLRRTGSRTSGANQAEKRDVETSWELVELHGLWWAYRGELPHRSGNEPGSLRRYKGKSQGLSAVAALFSALLAR